MSTERYELNKQLAQMQRKERQLSFPIRWEKISPL